MRTKTTIAALLAFTLVVPAGAAAPLVNQIDNHSFEDEEDALAEWRVISGPVSSTTEAADGDQAAKFSVPGDKLKSAIAQNVSLEREDAPVLPAQEYDFDFQAKLGQGVGSDSSPTTEGVVIWKNAFGEEVDRDTVTIAPSPDYLPYNNTFQAPEDATEAEIQFSLTRDSLTQQTDAELFVDDVAFGPADPT